MKTRLIPIVIVFVLILASCAGSSQWSVEKRIKGVESGLLRELGDPPWKRMKLADRMAHYNVPGISITVINDYQIEWTKGYGVLEVGKSEQVTPDTLFQVASIGKVVVAVAALHYVDNGILDLDSDVNQNLVSWQVPEKEFMAEEKVTLRRLLSHSAGVTLEWFPGYAAGEELPNLQQILDGEGPANSPPIQVDIVPGTQHRYSGGGYQIVQQLLEDVSGEPFPELVRTSVLDPWGMNASTFEAPLPANLITIAASGHRVDGSTIPGGWHTYPEMGAGGLWSTAPDMAKFAIGVMQAYSGLSDEVISQDLAVQMLTQQINERGLGPVVLDEGGDLFYFMHAGANQGYEAVMVGYPLRGQGVIILTNIDEGELLWREILNSVSVEYGWVRDYSYLYLLIGIVIIVAIGGVLYRRRIRTKGYSSS